MISLEISMVNPDCIYPKILSESFNEILPHITFFIFEFIHGFPS